MFIFLLIIAIFVLIGLIVFLMIELNSIEQDAVTFLQSIKRRYGEQ